MATDTSPYIGLRPFETADSHLFFGRIEQTTETLESLYRHRFVGIVGSSGCGKSSLIKAGVIPALVGGFLIDERSRWRIARLTPGDRPIRNLAAAICEATGSPADAGPLVTEIQETQARAVEDRLRSVLTPEENLLLLVDQFEEIFAFRDADDPRSEGRSDNGRPGAETGRRTEAADFVDLLLTLSRRPDLPVYVVLTMRSDFLGDCDVFYGLPEAMNRGRYLVPRLTRSQLIEAIEGPAKLFGASISRGLLDRLLNELGDRFDRLPVLQHVLARTWEEWQRLGGKGAIDIDHYTKVGTLAEALANHAKELLADLKKDPQFVRLSDSMFLTTVGRVFQSLTETDSANRQVKRAARLSRIQEETGLDRDTVLATLRPFRQAGFVFPGPDVEDVNPRFALSHESLIRQWPQLSEWVTAERDSRDHYLELVKLAAGQKAGKRGPLRNPDLQSKLAWWLSQKPVPEWSRRYTNRPEDFVEAADYLERSRKSTNRRWWAFASAISGALVVLAVVSAWALVNWFEARRQTLEARSQTEEAQRQKLFAETQTAEAKRLQAISDAQAQKLLSQTTALQDAVTAEKRAAVDANAARDDANRRAVEVRAGVIVAGFRDYSGGFTPQDRRGLWQLAEGREDQLRRAALGQFFASEAPVQRFAANSAQILHATIGYGPVERLDPIIDTFERFCLSLEQTRSYPERQGCRLLADAIVEAPDYASKRRLAGRIEAAILSRIETRSGRLTQDVEFAIVPLDAASLDRVFARAIDTEQARALVSAAAPALARVVSRLSDVTRRRFEEQLLRQYETTPFSLTSDLQQYGASLEFLTESTRQRLAGSITKRWGTLEMYDKRLALSFPTYLSDEQAFELAIDVLRAGAGLHPELPRLLARLSPQAASSVVEPWLAAMGNATRGYSDTVKSGTEVLFGRLPQAGRTRLAEGVMSLLDSVADRDYAAKLAEIAGVINAAREVTAARFSPVLERAVKRFAVVELIEHALGPSPDQPSVDMILGWLMAPGTDQAQWSAGRERTLARLAVRMSADQAAEYVVRLTVVSLPNTNNNALLDLVADGPATHRVAIVGRMIDELVRTTNPDVVARLARMFEGLEPILDNPQRAAIVSGIVKRLEDEPKVAVFELRNAAVVLADSASADTRRRLTRTLTAALATSPEYMHADLARLLAPLADQLTPAEWDRVSSNVIAQVTTAAEKSAEGGGYIETRAAVALAKAGNRLSAEQASQVAAVHVRVLRTADATYRWDASTAALIDLWPRLGAESRRQATSVIRAMTAAQPTPEGRPGPSPADIAKVVLRMAPMMEPTDYQAIRAALGRELDYAASFLNREFADDLVRFSKLLPPGEATALSDSVLRSLETGPPPDLATTVIDVFLRLKGVAERGNQALVDALKWPTLRTEVRSALIGALASRTSEDPKKLQQFNRWQFAEWARGKGLDVRTLRVPAQ